MESRTMSSKMGVLTRIALIAALLVLPPCAALAATYVCADNGDTCGNGTTKPVPPGGNCSWNAVAGGCSGCDAVTYSYGTPQSCYESGCGGAQADGKCNPPCVATCQNVSYGSTTGCEGHYGDGASCNAATCDYN